MHETFPTKADGSNRAAGDAYGVNKLLYKYESGPGAITWRPRHAMSTILYFVDVQQHNVLHCAQLERQFCTNHKLFDNCKTCMNISPGTVMRGADGTKLRKFLATYLEAVFSCREGTSISFCHQRYSSKCRPYTAEILWDTIVTGSASKRS